MARAALDPADLTLFGIDLGAELASAIDSAGGVTLATLTKRVTRDRATADTAGGTRALGTAYPCRVIVEETPGEAGKRMAEVTILAATLVDSAGDRIPPEFGDAITVFGEAWEIIAAPSGSAVATWTCKVSRTGRG